jgi:hypothetical protein
MPSYTYRHGHRGHHEKKKKKTKNWIKAGGDLKALSSLLYHNKKQDGQQHTACVQDVGCQDARLTEVRNEKIRILERISVIENDSAPEAEAELIAARKKLRNLTFEEVRLEETIRKKAKGRTARKPLLVYDVMDQGYIIPKTTVPTST